MTGPVRLRFLANFPAKAPVYPRKPPPKSFVKTILPVSPTRRRICAQIPAIFMKTRNFRGRGRGPPLSDIVPFWESQRPPEMSQAT